MTSEQHWDAFARFCAAELATGGPDPQVELTARATDRLHDREAAVFAGCFVGPYTCGAAGPLMFASPISARDVNLAAFISLHWEGLPRRRERRAIDKRSGEKLAECLLSWQAWVDHDLPHLRNRPYDELYTSVRHHVKYMGRYAAMKVLEVLFQRDLITHQQDSICAAGAKFPRRTLALLWPDHAEALTSSSDASALLELANRLAAATKERVDVASWFNFETLLCNYRQALAGKYAGRSHDRELAHFRRAETYWGPVILEWFPFYKLRVRLFPRRCLGELGDPPWYGARPELEVPFT